MSLPWDGDGGVGVGNGGLEFVSLEKTNENLFVYDDRTDENVETGERGKNGGGDLRLLELWIWA